MITIILLIALVVLLAGALVYAALKLKYAYKAIDEYKRIIEERRKYMPPPGYQVRFYPTDAMGGSDDDIRLSPL